MKLKHIFIFLLASLLLASCSDSDDDELTFENVVAQGTAGVDIKWVFQEDGTLTIYGKGKMPDYEFIETETHGSTAPWNKYLRSDVKKIVISGSITSIGDFAFYPCLTLTELTIPNSVTSIGGRAFLSCVSLTELTIPNSVTEIGEWAFTTCISLTKLTIPNSVTEIGAYAFEDCYELTKLIIPKSMTKIERGTFSNCYSLAELTIPNSVTEIGEWAFSDCKSLTELTIPESVTSIRENAFKSYSDVLKTIYSYCPMDAYSDKLVFNYNRDTDIVMYVNVMDIESYKAVQNTYWDHMNITISDSPAP